MEIAFGGAGWTVGRRKLPMFAVLKDILSFPWVVFGLGIAVVLLSWVLGGLFCRLVLRLADRISFSDRLSRFLRLSEPRLISLWIRRLTRWIILLLGAFWAWQMWITNAEIVRVAGEFRASIFDTLQLPAVTFLIDVALIVLATVLLVRVVGWVRRRFEELAESIQTERGKRLKGWKIQNLQLLSTDQAADLLLVGSRYMRYAFNLLLGLLYLVGIFSIFPQTRGFVAEGIHGISLILLTGWNNFLNYLPNLASLTVVAVVTHFGLRFVHFIFREIEKGTITLAGFQPEWAETTYKIVRALAVVLALVIAFPFLPGSSSPAFQGISIFIGALLSLGSTSVIGNIVAGVILTYAQAFRVGDRVQIGETIGDVIDKGLIATRIRTIKNVDVTIPNGIVMANHIINYSTEAQEQGLILHTSVTIGYDAPWRAVHETLIRAALATPGILATPKPFVFQTSLDDSYVSYEINAFTREPRKMVNIYSDLHQNIQDKFNEAQIEILSPRFSAVRDGNSVTLPADHRPAGYRPPSFRVKLDRSEEGPDGPEPNRP
jgi:small-conductance mechanosensitive channel